MSRTLLVLVLAFFGAALFMPASAHALNIPGVKDKKEEERKRKEEERKKKEEEDKKAAAQNSVKEEKEETAQPVAAPVADGESLTEMTINGETWEIYKKFKVGTFVEYSMPAQEGMKMRYEVTEVGENFVTIKTITSSPQFKQEAKMKYVFKGDAIEKVSAAGKEFNATRTDMSTNGTLVSRSWHSKEIPQLMGGTVKTEGADGKVQMILSAYGEGK